MLRTSEMKKIFDEGYTLADLLPYGEHWDGVFLNVDGSVGQVWEITLPGCEGMEASRLDEISRGLSGFIARVPSGVLLQMIAWSDRDVAGMMQAYRSTCEQPMDRIVERIMEEKVRRFFDASDNSSRDMGARRLRVFLAARSFPSWPSAGGDAGDWARVKGDLLRTCRMIESQLEALQIHFQALDSAALTTLLYRWLNPGRSRRIPVPVMGRDFIREQVLYHAPKVHGRGFILDGYHTRVLSLKELPQHTCPGMFAPMDALFDIHKDMLAVFNLVVPDQEAAVGRLKFQKTFAFMQRTSSMGDVSEEAVQKKEELSGLITRLFKDGSAVVHLRMHLIILGEDEDRLEQACDALAVHLHRSGAGALREEIIAPSLFLTCLPLNFDHRWEQFIRRERRVLSENLADMLPVYGAMRGTRTPAALYLNRRDEPVGIDLFDSDTNPHAVIIGASGAGKSFLTNDLIYQNYRLGGHFFVLDKGHSYRKTCQVLGGEYIHFDLKTPLAINPFFAPPTSENLAFLVEVLALMASGGDDRDRLTREEKGFLQQGVLQAYASVQGREVVLSDLLAVLHGGMGTRLALRLAPFAKNGQYGGFFDGPNAFHVDKRFTVFELAELSAYPDLQLVVLLNIMFFMTRFVSSQELRGQRKFLLIDEAWQLLKMANTADFIANAFKTFRKYRCAAIAITQEVTDLLQQESGLAILANTANKIFLKQEASVVERLKKELFLPEEIAALLRSVRTVKGRYSEALMMTPSSTGVVRLVPDPFLYWAATSEPRDNAYLEETRERLGGDLLAALAHCAEVYPYGVR